MDIRKELFALQDLSYKAFNERLLPEGELIGIRIPVLRKFAKMLSAGHPEETEKFLESLPHRYVEENHLHAFLLEEEKNPEKLIKRTEEFLPFIDNWQTCDSFLPAYYKKNHGDMGKFIDKWLASERTYTVRYAIRLMLARKDFREGDILKVIKAGKRDSYYIYMGAAWYLSMAAKENEKIFKKHFCVEDMDERLLVLTLKKIRESRQFSREEKDMYKKLADREINKNN